MTSPTTIAVLLPVHNGEQTLSRALDSIAWQLRKPDQIVAVNDGSTDSTQQILENYASRGLPITIERRASNDGLVSALQAGLKRTTTDWIARLDSDDLWLPHHLACIGTAVSAGDVLIGTRALIAQGANERLSRGPLSSGAIDLAMCWDNPFVHTATAFSRRHYSEVGGYTSSRFEDYDLWSRLARVGNARILAGVTAVHVKRAGSLSDIDRRKSLRARAELQLAHWRRLPWSTRVTGAALLLPHLLRLSLL
jgi:glycosyltransferase involved in cell wall biosynthesis